MKPKNNSVKAFLMESEAELGPNLNFKSDRSKRFNLKLTPEEFTNLKQVAEFEDLPIQKIVRRAIKGYLNGEYIKKWRENQK